MPIGVEGSERVQAFRFILVYEIGLQTYPATHPEMKLIRGMVGLGVVDTPSHPEMKLIC